MGAAKYSDYQENDRNNTWHVLIILTHGEKEEADSHWNTVVAKALAYAFIFSAARAIDIDLIRFAS